jgi:hypothetical protein
MLRWSGQAMQIEVDIDALATGSGTAGLAYGAELLGFVDALAGFDDASIGAARDRLVDAAGSAFMIDAAAVAANFEMMTRVADGTGASFAPAQHAARAAVGAQLGVYPRAEQPISTTARREA